MRLNLEAWSGSGSEDECLSLNDVLNLADEITAELRKYFREVGPMRPTEEGGVELDVDNISAAQHFSHVNSVEMYLGNRILILRTTHSASPVAAPNVYVEPSPIETLLPTAGSALGDFRIVKVFAGCDLPGTGAFASCEELGRSSHGEAFYQVDIESFQALFGENPRAVVRTGPRMYTVHGCDLTGMPWHPTDVAAYLAANAPASSDPIPAPSNPPPDPTPTPVPKPVPRPAPMPYQQHPSHLQPSRPVVAQVPASSTPKAKPPPNANPSQPQMFFPLANPTPAEDHSPIPPFVPIIPNQSLPQPSPHPQQQPPSTAAKPSAATSKPKPVPKRSTPPAAPTPKGTAKPSPPTSSPSPCPAQIRCEKVPVNYQGDEGTYTRFLLQCHNAMCRQLGRPFLSMFPHSLMCSLLPLEGESTQLARSIAHDLLIPALQPSLGDLSLNQQALEVLPSKAQDYGYTGPMSLRVMILTSTRGLVMCIYVHPVEAAELAGSRVLFRSALLLLGSFVDPENIRETLLRAYVSSRGWVLGGHRLVLFDPVPGRDILVPFCSDAEMRLRNAQVLVTEAVKRLVARPTEISLRQVWASMQPLLVDGSGWPLPKDTNVQTEVDQLAEFSGVLWSYEDTLGLTDTSLAADPEALLLRVQAAHQKLLSEVLVQHPLPPLPARTYDRPAQSAPPSAQPATPVPSRTSAGPPAATRAQSRPRDPAPQPAAEAHPQPSVTDVSTERKLMKVQVLEWHLELMKRKMVLEDKEKALDKEIDDLFQERDAAVRGEEAEYRDSRSNGRGNSDRRSRNFDDGRDGTYATDTTRRKR